MSGWRNPWLEGFASINRSRSAAFPRPALPGFAVARRARGKTSSELMSPVLQEETGYCSHGPTLPHKYIDRMPRAAFRGAIPQGSGFSVSKCPTDEMYFYLGIEGDRYAGRLRCCRHSAW